MDSQILHVLTGSTCLSCCLVDGVRQISQWQSMMRLLTINTSSGLISSQMKTQSKRGAAVNRIDSFLKFTTV